MAQSGCAVTGHKLLKRPHVTSSSTSFSFDNKTKELGGALGASMFKESMQFSLEIISLGIVEISKDISVFKAASRSSFIV